MKWQKHQPPLPKIKSRTDEVLLPITLAILGASVMLMAVMLVTTEKSNKGENDGYDVENYDVVGNMPYIYSICE